MIGPFSIENVWTIGMCASCIDLITKDHPE